MLRVKCGRVIDRARREGVGGGCRGRCGEDRRLRCGATAGLAARCCMRRGADTAPAAPTSPSRLHPRGGTGRASRIEY